MPFERYFALIIFTVLEFNWIESTIYYWQFDSIQYESFKLLKLKHKLDADKFIHYKYLSRASLYIWWIHFEKINLIHFSGWKIVSESQKLFVFMWLKRLPFTKDLFIFYLTHTIFFAYFSLFLVFLLAVLFKCHAFF